jgi:hypothetical protein
MFRRLIVTTLSMCIGILLLSLYSFESVRAQNPDESGHESTTPNDPSIAMPANNPPPPEIMDSPAATNDNASTKASGPQPYEDQGPVTPPPRQSPALTGLREIHVASPIGAKSNAKPEPPPDNPNWKTDLVEVEGDPYVRIPGTNRFEIQHYGKRRRPFGFDCAIGMSSYSPAMAKNNVSTTGVSTQYAPPQTSLIEVQFGPRWNFMMGSLALDLGAGQYYGESHGDTIDTTLTVTIVHVGARYTLDTLMREPYIAPYVAGGVYQVSYSEQGSDSAGDDLNNTGSNPIAPYFAVGANLQLNWLDQRTARNAFREIGLLNGSLFVEARQLLSSTSGYADMSSNGVYLNGGVRLEF